MASVEKKSNMKRVQFSCHVEHISTFANEEYDRTAQDVAKLTYHDMLELLTLKSEWRRQMESMLADRRRKEQNSSEDNNNDEQLEAAMISPAQQHEICA